jgi:hypothetical protein
MLAIKEPSLSVNIHYIRSHTKCNTSAGGPSVLQLIMHPDGDPGRE